MGIKVESGLAWDLEPDNGLPTMGAGETKMKKVKVWWAHSTLLVRHKIIHVRILKETKLCHPR